MTDTGQPPHTTRLNLGRFILKHAAITCAVLLTAFALYVWLTPDNLVRDNFFDKWRAANAKSSMVSSDTAPLGGRAAWIWVHDFGLQSADEYGPPEHIVRRRFAPLYRNLPLAWREEYGLDDELFAAVKVWQFHYDSARDPAEVGRDLDALIEGDRELTRGSTRLVLLGLSHGGRIIHDYQLVSRGRKLVRAVSIGTPHTWLALADPLVAEESCVNAYPLLGSEVYRIIYGSLDFHTPGIEAMLPGNAGLERLHRLAPLDSRWVLYGGVIEPDEGTLLDAAWTSLSLLNAMFLLQDDSMAADLASPVGARIIESSGEYGGSDGLVPLSAAHARGWTQGAVVRTFEGYNHRNLLEGRDNDPEYFRRLIRDLVEPEVD